MHLVHLLSSVNDNAPPRLLRGNLKKALPRAFMKIPVHAFIALNMVASLLLPLLPVGAAIGPLQPYFHVKVEN
mgnify:CR=1 FL=1